LEFIKEIQNAYFTGKIKTISITFLILQQIFLLNNF